MTLPGWLRANGFDPERYDPDAAALELLHDTTLSTKQRERWLKKIGDGAPGAEEKDSV